MESLSSELQKKSDKKKAELLQRFFKTGKGEYGEGDVFIGLTVPMIRHIARQFDDIGYKDLKKHLASKIHEERLAALLILVRRYEKAEAQRQIIFDFYLQNAKGINNWDLVDLSAPNILGRHLISGERKILYEMAKSKNIWERRMAVLATFAFIRNKEFGDSLKIADILLDDKHDLIHKAVGWMLREIGKRDLDVEEKFLKSRCKKMPRTMLRYAIERFPEAKRKKYLEGRI